MNSQEAILADRRTKGIVLVLIAAILWGVSGTVAQYLFHEKGFQADWLVVTRLLSSGILLLLFAQFVLRQNIGEIWRKKRDVIQLILFGIIGMLGVQYTYFAAIQHGNAATATILQYLAPVLITCFICFRAKQFPAKHELAAISLALLGTFLLVTNGKIDTLLITRSAFFWGIASAFALAFYTLQPGGLLKSWGSFMTVGWGMVIGGIGLSLTAPPWNFKGEWSFTAFLAVLFVVIFGTLIAFFCYMESLKYISATETSLLASAEPLSATFLAVAWLHVPFGLFEWIGTICIISTIFILSIVKHN
ncbi:DMT family transporter [Bacillota bacterium Lsc_1132]